MNPLGFVLPAASLGLGAAGGKNLERGIITAAGKIVAQCVIEEVHDDAVEITDQPVQSGATISDHAIRRPAQVVLKYGWSNSRSTPGGFLNNIVGSAAGVAATIGGPVVGNVLAAGQTIAGFQSLFSGNGPDQIRAMYDKLLDLQRTRQLVEVITGKRRYKNMLLAQLEVTTDGARENSLCITIVVRELILVQVQTVMVPINPDPSAQADPELTQPVVDRGVQQLQPGKMAPDAASFGSSIGELKGCFGDVQNIFGSVPAGGLSEIASTALKTLPSALEPAQALLQTITNALPSPMEIPFIAGPQSFTISLGGALENAQSVLSTAVRQLPAVLESVQPAIAQAIQQLPSVIDQLPTAFSGLTDVLNNVQTQIVDVLKKVPQALERAPLPSAP